MPFNVNGNILTALQLKNYNEVNIVRNGLALYLDAGIANSYPGSGTSWFDRKVIAKPVVYVALEAEAGLKQRTDAWCKHHGQAMPTGLTFIVDTLNLVSQGDVQALVNVLLILDHRTYEPISVLCKNLKSLVVTLICKLPR